MRDGVYLARYRGSPVIKLTRKTSDVLFITDISILDISSIISHLTVPSEVTNSNRDIKMKAISAFIEYTRTAGTGFWDP